MGFLCGYEDLGADIRRQIDRTVRVWQEQVGENLVGVYLHGSIALKAFCPQSGDVDLLIVLRENLSAQERLAVARRVIKLDQCPRPLEMSAILLCDAQAWKTPGRCVFHYSDFWTERYLKRLADPSAECFVVDHDFPDADVTGYIRLLRQCGLTLCGAPIREVFGEISDEDFWAALTADVDDYDFHACAPRYLASNVLILGRILSFKEKRHILSKYEAGLWMIGRVPAALAFLPRNAMKIWFGGSEAELPEDGLAQLREYLIGEIKK